MLLIGIGIGTAFASSRNTSVSTITNLYVDYCTSIGADITSISDVRTIYNYKLPWDIYVYYCSSIGAIINNIEDVELINKHYRNV